MNLAEWGLKMRQAEVSCNSQLHSEHKTVYTLRVRKSHVKKECNHRTAGMRQKHGFPQGSYKQVTIARCSESSEVESLVWAAPGRGTEAQSKSNPCPGGTGSTRLSVLFPCSFLTRSQKSPHKASFRDCVLDILSTQPAMPKSARELMCKYQRGHKQQSLGEKPALARVRVQLQHSASKVGK